MHPILFRIPLPSFNLPYAWIPLIVAALAVLIAAAKMVGKEKDRQGAMLGGAAAVIALIVRFAVMRDSTESWNVGNIPIYSYGVMLGLSLVVGWYLTLGLAERDGLPKETMANNYVVTAIAAVAGSRVLYILTNLDEFTHNQVTHDALGLRDTLAAMFAMRRGGLVAYGGFLGGLAGSYFFLRRHKIPLLPWADVAVPSLASGLMITRIGCYLFGCDFGQPLTEGAPAFLKKLGTFPHWAKGTLDNGQGAPAWAQHASPAWAHAHPDLPQLTEASTASYPVHPTQLYESLVGACLLALLLWYRRKQKFRGEIFFLFAFAYGVCRYLLEILRDDAERGSIPPALPEHILIPFGLAILAFGWYIGFSNRIQNVAARRASQVFAFLTVVALYLALKPASFKDDGNIEFSTSQMIGIVSAFAASAAFAVFYKAALAHPKHAMDLGLPVPALAGDAGDVPAPEQAAAEDDEEEVRRPAPKKTAKGKGKGKKKAKTKPLEEGAGGEEERAPAVAEATKEEEEPKGTGEDEGGGGEPLKAG
jgi:phosphatidylglycerol---prolipoprotein diacylglyceryl transferase